MPTTALIGLGAALFTENITKAHRVARLIESGMVWINSSNDGDIRIPFGCQAERKSVGSWERLDLRRTKQEGTLPHPFEISPTFG